MPEHKRWGNFFLVATLYIPQNKCTDQSRVVHVMVESKHILIPDAWTPSNFRPDRDGNWRQRTDSESESQCQSIHGPIWRTDSKSWCCQNIPDPSIVWYNVHFFSWNFGASYTVEQIKSCDINLEPGYQRGRCRILCSSLDLLSRFVLIY